MEPKELSQMRLKQVGLVNTSILIAMAIFTIATNFFTIKFTHFFFALGVVMLIQGVYGLFRGKSTKSIFPFIEKVATYEKQRMGIEWDKQRKAGNITNILLAFILFLQAYTIDETFQPDLLFISVIIIFILIMMNIGMILRFRKVDSSEDLKGYAWKSIVIGVGVAIAFTVLIVGFIVFYVISGIG